MTAPQAFGPHGFAIVPVHGTVADDTAMTPTLRELAYERVAPFLERLMSMPETEAVAVLSNATQSEDRLPFDEHSDFDVAVVVDVPLRPEDWRPVPADTYRILAPSLPVWLPNFSFHVSVPWGRLEVNVNQLLFAYEADARTEWDDAKCEAYATAGEIIYDRSSRFAALVADKAARRAAKRPQRIVALANRLDWDVRELPVRQAARGELTTAHALVGRALDELVDLCFLLADRFIPNPKWRLLVLRRDELLTDAELAAAEAVMACNPGSHEDLLRRVAALEELWRAVRARSPVVPAAPYRTLAATQLQLQARTVGDKARELMGEDAYDAANFLLACDTAQL